MEVSMSQFRPLAQDFLGTLKELQPLWLNPEDCKKHIVILETQAVSLLEELIATAIKENNGRQKKV
jgi:hypothetical protein